MTLMELPQVQDCSASACGYNHDGCHAPAVTIGGHGHGDHAHCTTFVDTSTKGGLDIVTGQVGACSRTDCQHNDSLVCHAPAIRVGPGSGSDVSDCLTYAEA